MAHIDDNLSAIWRMDEASGSRINAYGSAPSLTDNGGVTAALGQVGNGAVTSRTGPKYLSCASHASLQIGSATSMTWSLWLKMTDLDLPQQSVFSKDGETTREYALNANSVGSFSLYIFDGDSSGFTQIISPVGALVAGQWHHVACRWDHAANLVSIRVDGGEVTSGAGPAAGPATGTTAFHVGNRVISDLPASMTIDEFCVWQRALSLSELGFVYQLGKDGRSLADYLNPPVVSARPVLSSPFLIGSLR